MRSAISSPLVVLIVASSLAAYGDPHLMSPSPRLVTGRTVGRSSVPYARPSRVADGDPRTVWDAGRPSAEQPAWIAFDVGTGPQRLVLEWSARGSFDYDETDYGSPGSYRVETSADSTDGTDGSWRTVVAVDGV